MCKSLVGNKITHFELTDVLGQGGMGCVYKALDLKMDRTVALKLIRHKFGMFSSREGKALAKLNHPNVVNVFHMDENSEGVFIVMEYISGHTLRSFKNTSIPKALNLFKQSLYALEHAHNADIIHRDIKPGNIMVNNQGQVKVMDFGIAKVNSSDANRTVTSFQAGTLNYMSPEQIRGLQIDRRSDIYSLGKTFYEIFAGRLPFDPNDSDQYDIRRMIVEVKFKSPSHFNKRVSPEIDKLIMKALEKDPADRFQSASEMISAIELIEQDLNKIPQKTKTYSEPKTRQASKKGIYIAGALLTSLIAVFALFQLNILPLSPPPATSILITTTPSDANILLNNQALGPSPSDTLSLDKSEAQISISKPNFEQLDTTLTVNEGTFTHIQLALNPLPADPSAERSYFEITSTPSGATILIDGAEVGKTPHSGEIEPGSYSVEWMLPEYEKHTATITMNAGVNQPVSANLLKHGTIQVSSNQNNASIYINNQYIGRAPRTISRAEGNYNIEVRADGFLSASKTVYITPQSAQIFEASLAPLMAELRVRVNPFGAIYINGSLEEAEEMGWFEKKLPRGKYLLRAVHPSFGEWEKEITLNGDTEEVRINFRAQKTVNIASGRVRGAQVFVDGKPISNFETPGELLLNVGKRRIEVRKDGFTSSPAFHEILIEDNSAEPIRVKFELSQ